MYDLDLALSVQKPWVLLRWASCTICQSGDRPIEIHKSCI